MRHEKYLQNIFGNSNREKTKSNNWEKIFERTKEKMDEIYICNSTTSILTEGKQESGNVRSIQPEKDIYFTVS